MLPSKNQNSSNENTKKTVFNGTKKANDLLKKTAKHNLNKLGVTSKTAHAVASSPFKLANITLSFSNNYDEYKKLGVSNAKEKALFTTLTEALSSSLPVMRVIHGAGEGLGFYGELFEGSIPELENHLEDLDKIREDVDTIKNDQNTGFFSRWAATIGSDDLWEQRETVRQQIEVVKDSASMGETLRDPVGQLIEFISDFSTANAATLTDLEASALSYLVTKIEGIEVTDDKKSVVEKLNKLEADYYTDLLNKESQNQYVEFTTNKTNHLLVQQHKLLTLFKENSSFELSPKTRQDLKQIATTFHDFGAFGNATSQLALRLGGHQRTWLGVQNVANGFVSMGSGIAAIANAGTMLSFGAITGGIGILCGALSLASGLFGNDDESNNGLQELFNAIMHMHQDMLQNFAEVKKLIYDNMGSVLLKLDTINQKLDRLEEIFSTSFVELHKTGLIKSVSLLEQDVRGEWKLPVDERNKSLGEIVAWIDKISKARIQTSLHRDSVDAGKILQILTSENYDNYTMLPFALFQLAKLRPDSLPSSVNLNEIPSLSLLLSLCERYIYFISYYKENDPAFDIKYPLVITRIVKELENIKEIIFLLQDRNDLWEDLFQETKQLRYAISIALYRAIKSVPATTSKHLSLKDAHASKELEQLIQLLNQFEVRKSLFKHMHEIVGIPIDYYNALNNVASKDKILAQTIEDYKALDPRLVTEMNNAISSKNYSKLEEILLAGADINTWNGSYGMNLVHILGKYHPTSPIPNYLCYQAHFPKKLLHHLLCYDSDLQLNNRTSVQLGDTWGTYLLPIQHYLNCAIFSGAFLLTAHGFDIIESNKHFYVAIKWANEGHLHCIIQLRLVQDMNSPTGLLNKKDLRQAYRFYKAKWLGDNSVSEEGLNHTCLLWIAAVLGELHIIQKIKNFKPDFNKSITTRDDVTPLMMATYCGNIELVNYMLENGAILPTNKENLDSILSLVLYEKNYKAIEFLSKNGIKTTDKQFIELLTKIHHASKEDTSTRSNQTQIMSLPMNNSHVLQVIDITMNSLGIIDNVALQDDVVFISNKLNEKTEFAKKQQGLFCKISGDIVTINDEMCEIVDEEDKKSWLNLKSAIGGINQTLEKLDIEADIIQKPSNISHAQKPDDFDVRVSMIDSELRDTLENNDIHDIQKYLDKDGNHAKITGELIDAVATWLEYSTCSNKNDILALLYFKKELQKITTQSEYDFTKIIQLINQLKLALKEEKTEDAVLFMGKTRAGKSTLVNALHGVKYEIKKRNLQKFLHTSDAELTKTSDTSVSETIFPQILPKYKNHQYHMVDMPGFDATQGIEWDIATSVFSQMLGNVFSKLKALVAVIAYKDISETNFDSKNIFDTLGNIVNQSPELLKHIVIIVNKCNDSDVEPEDVIERLKTVATEHTVGDSAYTKNTLYVLNNMSPANVILLNIPDDKFRNNFSVLIDAIVSKPFNEFNFFNFLQSTKQLSKLFEAIVNHEKEVLSEFNKVYIRFSAQKSEEINGLLGLLENNFADTLGKIGNMPQEFMAQKQKLEAIFQAHTMIHEVLSKHLQAMKQCFSAHKSSTLLHTIVVGENILDALLLCRARLKTIQDFFNFVAPIMSGVGYQRAPIVIEDLNANLDYSHYVPLKRKTENQQKDNSTKIHPKKWLTSNADISFEVDEVLGDGNCGYTAFGITRQDAHTLLSNNITEIQDQLKVSVREALLLDDFLQYLQTNQVIDSSVTREQLEANDGELIQRYSADLVILQGYINYDVRDKRIDLGWAHPAVLQALAKIQGISLYIWQPGDNQKLMPHHFYHHFLPQNATQEVDLLFVNGNHFDRLNRIKKAPQRNAFFSQSYKDNEKTKEATSYSSQAGNNANDSKESQQENAFHL
ncbi:MAG: hypothetical protein LEGION0398_MBIBDBAK_00550 [Legionellaceae bacterium]